jgi:hypothetical protein
MTDYIIKEEESFYKVTCENESEIEICDLDVGGGLYKTQFTFNKWTEYSITLTHSEALSTKLTEVKDESNNITNLIVDDPSTDYYLETYRLACGEYGGLEIEIVLESNPISNIIEFDINFTDGLDFAYQPPLTEDTDLQAMFDDRVYSLSETEAKDGEGNVIAFRPENIIGSYAVYAPKQHNKYKTGKITHIERPKAIDDNGVEQWCELNIDVENKKLYITIPQSFLDSASYPIIVDPTFGYTSIGASSTNNWDIIGGQVANPGEAGTVTKITAYLGDDLFGDNRKCALYTSGGTLVSPQSSQNSASRPSAGWEDFTVANASVTAQNYVVSYWANWVDPTIYYDTGGASGTSKYVSQSYGSWPASVTFSNSTNYLSIYATYTSAGISVSDVDTDDDVFDGQLSTNINGSVFEASQGTGKVEFGNAATYGACTILIEQPISSWSDTQITLTKIRKGNLSYGTVYVYVTNDSAEQSDGHAFTIRQEWGMLTVPSGNPVVNFCLAMGGDPPNVDNMILRSASIYVGATHTAQVRLAVYQGGVLSTGPDGATLLKDFGLTTGSATNQWLELTHVGNDIDVNKTDPIWISFKGNDSGFNVRNSSSSLDAEDFQTARGRYETSVVSIDETVAYASTWPSDSGSFGNFWYAVKLKLEILGWEGGKVNTVNWYYIGKVNGIARADISTVKGI